MEEILNNDLQTNTAWSKQWLVKFNPSKTELMFFLYYNRNRPFLYFDNVELNFVEHHKNLGVTISQDGSWNQHIANIVSA